MKIQRGIFFTLVEPMQITLGEVLEEFFTIKKIHSRGSIIYPFEYTRFKALTCITLTPLKENNFWYDLSNMLKIENYILREKNEENRLLILLYYFYTKEKTTLINTNMTRTKLAQYLNISPIKLREAIKNYEKKGIIEIYNSEFLLNIKLLEQHHYNEF